jgi:hypothetical protein
MNLNLNETWRELYDAGRVRWMAGMLTTTGHRLSDMDDGYFALTMRSHGGGYATKNLTSYTPDFTDPATRGCLLEQARKAWDDPGLTVAGEYCPTFDPAWRVTGNRYCSEFQRLAMIGHGNEPSAILAAILAAIQAAPPKVTE